MKRIRNFTDTHPLISILLGWVVLFAIAAVLLPADPPYVDQAMHRSAT